MGIFVLLIFDAPDFRAWPLRQHDAARPNVPRMDDTEALVGPPGTRILLHRLFIYMRRSGSIRRIPAF
jgi:hypothetical protein